MITLAGAVVLAVFPTVIPAAVGITLEPSDYLLVYLVAAAELAAAVSSFGAARLTDRAALRIVVATFVILHGASGLLNLLYITQAGWSAVANTAPDCSGRSAHRGAGKSSALHCRWSVNPGVSECGGHRRHVVGR